VTYDSAGKLLSVDVDFYSNSTHSVLLKSISTTTDVVTGIKTVETIDNVSNNMCTVDVKKFALNGSVLNEIKTATSADGKTIITSTDGDGNGAFEKVEKKILFSDQYYSYDEDNNGDGNFENRTIVKGNQIYDLFNKIDLFNIEKQIVDLNALGLVSTPYYLDFTQSVASLLVSSSLLSTTTFPSITPILFPIGAFYETRTPAVDAALSVSNKTFVILDSNKRKMSAAALAAKDVDRNNKLMGSELNNLYVWIDTDENGINNNEIVTLAQAGITEIRSTDYTFYTQGNARFVDSTLVAPTKRSEQTNVFAALPLLSRVDKTMVAPASNFRSLRDSDNRYVANLGGGAYWWVDWAANQVKINNSNRTYMIGTDGNDRFDANSYAIYSQYFNVNILVNFLAGGGDDVMGGSVRDDNLWGGTGNDVLLGYDGNDKIYSEEGNDELNGAQGNDYLDGGVGNNRFFGGGGNDTLVGGDGADLMNGFTASNDTKQSLNVGEGDDDWMYGGRGADSMSGGLGNDYIDAGDDNDVVSAGAGNDTVFAGAGADEVHGNDGNDWLAGESGDDILLGEAGNDTLLGGAENDQLDGGDGNDYLEAGSGNDLLLGQNGNDSLVGGINDNELNGGAGNDLLWGDAGNDKMFGGVGNDTLWGGSGDDVILGFTPSNDAKQTLSLGEYDNDVIFAGAGGDNVYAGLGNDYIDGGDGEDLLSGEDGADTLFGGVGNDQLLGGIGNDSIMGEEGEDRLFGGVGDDLLFGGDGNDVIVGFNPTNAGAQTLAAGETDNDTIYGGTGDDFVLARFGKDVVFGGIGNDEIQGGDDNDALYGEVGDDRLFGQTGNDTMYGGDGSDLLMGFMGANEAKTTLNAGETDDDFLYGGAGSDTLVGGLGNDYVDGGAGADVMEGGTGDDIYIVNSVNDSILERSNEGYDTVISSSNYILNSNIEELRLLEGFNIHGTGNALNNKIIGNSSDNILDGVTGADTMIGAAGNDIYYVDNLGDQVIELANEGNDTVQSTMSYTLANNVENLSLLDFSKPEKGLVDDVPILVYGYPKMNELDYSQGDAVPDYQGTCALTSIANLLTQADVVASEAQVIQVAMDNHWMVMDASLPAYRRGGSNYIQQQALLSSFGIRNQLLAGYNEEAIGNLIRSGRGVMIGLNAGVLWGDNNYRDDGGVNHVVTITGAAYNEATGSLMGFYIADSGRQKVSDMTRYISLDLFRSAANVSSAYSIYTTEALKMWDENINATGNTLDNILMGNRGNNVLSGLAGNDQLDAGLGADTLIGGTGNDTLIGGLGDDVYQFARGDGVDTLIENDATVGNLDTLQFGSTVRYDQLWFSHVANNLEVSVIGTNDKVIINNWYLGSQYQVERMNAGGRQLSSTNIENLVQAMAGFAAPSAGQTSLTQTTLTQAQKTQLNAIIATNWV
jgi:Ca2+-binding RTX toxin-like protein